jgi:hypothetical protein
MRQRNIIAKNLLDLLARPDRPRYGNRNLVIAAALASTNRFGVEAMRSSAARAAASKGGCSVAIANEGIGREGFWRRSRG